MRTQTSLLDAAVRRALWATAIVIAGGANAQQAPETTPPAADPARAPASMTNTATERQAGGDAKVSEVDRSGTPATAASTTAGSTTPSSAAPASGTADGSASASARRAAGTASAPSSEAVWILIPVELSTRSQQLSNGCWVQLYSGDNFQGRAMTVVGPTNLAEVRSPYGTGLNNWESAVVGPNATVTTYDDENFRARDATLRAGQRYAELDDSKLGLFEDIESMRVTCSNASGPSSPSSASGAAATTDTAKPTGAMTAPDR